MEKVDSSPDDEAPDFGRHGKRIHSLRSVARRSRSPRARMERHPRAKKDSSSWGAGVVGFKWDFENMPFSEARETDPMVLVVTTKKGSEGFPK